MVKSNSSKEKILKLLLENKEKIFSINSIAFECKINYKSAYNAIIELEKEKLIEVKSAGNTKICSLNNSFSPLLFQVEYNRKMDFIEKNNFSVLLQALERLPYNHVTLLFGSYVKKNQTKNSDIDLLIITEHEKEINSELELLPLNIHATYITLKEFLIMLKSKEFSVVSQALKKNIILVGIEQYYRILKNVI